MKQHFVFPSQLSLNGSQLEWLQQIIVSIHDGVLVIDAEGIVRMINPEYTRITGVQPGQIVGKSLLSVRPGAQLVNVLKDGKSVAGLYRKEKNQEYVVDMAPIHVNNEIIGAVSICKSINEIQHLSAELERKNAQLNQLKKTVNSIHEAKYTFNQIIGAAGDLRPVVEKAEKAAESELPVLITGESGTGKELFAQSIHNQSVRANKPFIAVNCAALPDSLMESEMFGYQEGAFTNSKKGGKLGMFELADQGTIFLDEIGELSFDLQAKLLRVLQEQRIRRIGEEEERKINVRLISATNKDLTQLIAKKHFREDVFYRLNVLNINIPPVRRRKADLRDLVYCLMKQAERKVPRLAGNVKISEQVIKMVEQHDWPGNVRELKNAIEYALCMAEGPELKPEYFPETITKHFRGEKEPRNQNVHTSLKGVLSQAEKDHLYNILSQYDPGVEGKKQAATALGISLASLYNKMKKYNLK
ncbi:sigma-54 interaction domain-containing protein [Salsuginibacillus kocurii]|uniref:sigma-54 interaction domain-containing protein n=1 Tax=Salsuginibacillus kocurii TaxID=427078 RepID=UPI00037D1FD1|nr:sigma 54-interacting transcriptional regulator [Salsuginibacillus kocurii]